MYSHTELSKHAAQWKVVFTACVIIPPPPPPPVMDMRLSPHDDHEAIRKMIQGWMDEAGNGCTMEVVQLNPKFPMTSTEDSDPWWKAFSTACDKQCALYIVYNSCVYIV